MSIDLLNGMIAIDPRSKNASCSLTKTPPSTTYTSIDIGHWYSGQCWANRTKICLVPAFKQLSLQAALTTRGSYGTMTTHGCVMSVSPAIARKVACTAWLSCVSHAVPIRERFLGSAVQFAMVRTTKSALRMVFLLTQLIKILITNTELSISAPYTEVTSTPCVELDNCSLICEGGLLLDDDGCPTCQCSRQTGTWLKLCLKSPWFNDKLVLF